MASSFSISKIFVSLLLNAPPASRQLYLSAVWQAVVHSGFIRGRSLKTAACCGWKEVDESC